MSQKHIISALVENHSGVLARVSTLISGRGFNIDSLAVGETHDPTVSRMTIVMVGDDRVCEQMIKQLNKLVDVIKVEDFRGQDIIDRELMIAKVQASAETRSDIMQIVNTFRAKIVDVTGESLTVEVTGNESKIDAILELLDPFGLQEVVRTGMVAMSRGRALKTPKKKPIPMSGVQSGKAKKGTAKAGGKKVKN